ncbi:beta-ketoacyl-[acyl-carrier-protein] synthase family protein [Bythopirellula polymerisocia]|uniref:3-oxoacyl-[acyl-carrier-protein] synthase 2 n=1 Tax=Bythopirellula polymerisocia TaxID=2528003 RepID=A0A5C6CBH2_9BACT|nr:beta-ketoacyl synthase N-terminal-like domain-containing protein [Bythopirellula polymerisocia]TWU21980.1 3-oxoacyl-[acyl-carrier-protein] synthase 2 [Bythopirellula polymerisocia]
MNSSVSPRRVVITGLGVVCPLGNSVAELSDALAGGRSGVRPLTLLPPIEDRVTFGGECLDFTGEIDNFGPLEKEIKKAIRKALKVMCRETMMAIAAAQQALADAKIADRDPERSGVVFGSDYMLSPPDDFVDGMVKCGARESKFSYPDWGSSGLEQMSPLWMLKFLPNMPGSHIAILNDLRGPNNSLTMREASGLMAIREAVHTIQRGHADLMLAGATGTRIHSFKTVHAIQTEQLASPECPPAEASRPFDAKRSGMVVGEGAGSIVLEEMESAQQRGATIYGEILGTGSSIVTNSHLAGNRRQALTNAMRAAIDSAKLTAAECGHINAHGLSTTESDADESSAIGEVFGDASRTVPVVAAKSYFGNLGAGSGIVELVASTLALGKEQLFGTLNYSSPDPACPLSVSAVGDLPPGTSFLKLSVTPQAQAAAILVSQV